MRTLSRLPIRLRLTAAFAVAMAVVLAATGLFLYFRLARSLDQAIDDGLRTRVDDVSALVRQSDSGLREGGGPGLAEQGESFAQVLTLDGGLVDTTPQLGDIPLLSPVEVVRAAERPIFLERRSVPGSDDAARLLAAPIEAQDQRLIVVVGAATEGRTEALQSLLAQLLLGGPIALLLASALAYALAAGALRPVELMRRQAGAISASEPGRRLPVPEAQDEIARLGHTLNEMLARLENALERERSFVSDASHELRTPLALLKTELELALRRTRTREELEAALRSAAEETDRLARLAEDLLVLARADQGRLPLRPSRIAAAELLRTVASRFGGQGARRISVEAPTGLAVTGDRLRLEQALGNLVDNALRHGGGDITLTATAKDGIVELHVLDDGPGVPDDFLATAFERFSRPDVARSDDGTGLGLAIARVIARAHRGEAKLANRQDTRGLDAWLELPAVRDRHGDHGPAVHGDDANTAGFK